MSTTATSTISDHLRSQYASLDAHEVVRSPVTALLGVSEAAKFALHGVGILTVFDLGASALFANARAAAKAADNGTPSSRFGIAPADWLKDSASWSTLESIGRLSIHALRELTDAQATALESALDVKTIRDLAYWPPHVVARHFVGLASGSTMDPDQQQTEALRPMFGDYPTERVYYTTLVMLQMQTDDIRRDLLHSPISVFSADEHQDVPHPLAIGATLTFSQSWYAQGITLGHLLHSLALAPGEATRVAVVDWSRRSKASDVEAATEGETLDNSMDHARSISEVQNAVANEMQQGGSHTQSSSSSSSSSASASVGTGFLTSLYASGDVSGTTETASSNTDASSSSWSAGNRSVMGQMAQNVNDRTEQHASSVRNRRASAVSEVSQSEHEQVSTRIVANYNHMHALTVQYFEVVQVYRVVTQLHRADRCLFVPLQALDFDGPHPMDVVERFRGAFVRNALSRRAAELLLDHGAAVAVIPEAEMRMPSFRRITVRKPVPVVNQEKAIEKEVERERALEKELEREKALEKIAIVSGTHEQIRHLAQELAHIRENIARMRKTLDAHTHDAQHQHLWRESDLASISRIVFRPVIRPGSHALHLPDDAELLGISFNGVHVQSITIDHIGAGPANTVGVPEHSIGVDLPSKPRLSDLNSISVTKHDDAPSTGTVTLLCSYLGRHFSSPPIQVSLGPGHGVRKVVSFKGEADDRKRELVAHLKANRAHYSTAAFRSLDAAMIVRLLSRYTWNGKPLIDQVEPRPMSVSGNYLILRAPVEQDESSGAVENGHSFSWGELLKSRGIQFGEGDQRLIPIPSSGVFAEAVLGRSNSAEKLDITRFWHWQDSPIPLTPTDIQPVGMGSRATAEEAKPQGFSQPIVGMMTPTALPNPAGVGAVLGAVSSGNMFRDMSGLAGTQALSQAGMTGTLQAATSAGQLASANMQTEAQKSVAMGQIAADLVKSLMGAPGGGGGTAQVGSKSAVGGISATGANINHGQSLDSRGVPVPGSSGTASGGGAASGNGKGTSGVGPKTSSIAGGTGPNPLVSTASWEGETFGQNALGYSPGLMNAAWQMPGFGGGGGGGGGVGSGGGGTGSPSPVGTGSLGSRNDMAQSLIKIGGSADASDAALVVTELLAFPADMLLALITQGIRVVVCRGSVTDYLTDLKGVHPRGWRAGATWDNVPGDYRRTTNEVVIAVIGHRTAAGPHVPRTGEGHGSFNMVLHESTHAIDRQPFGSPPRNSDPDFQAARTADFASLTPYQKQPGDAGLEETYAESAARFFGGDPTDAVNHPNLHAYWPKHIPGPTLTNPLPGGQVLT